ncbi:arsenate reductase [Alishewanella longhuensis]|uniref:Arsenate reductase n=1 Tax=Alishewanella longhuensis TaxID=1091037 RepID=A0ABQ3KZX1_9ALTE|nr:ArsC family reductase [Alishewanella longhuensis]GHG70776.1 arsenate reductase [Alishewanella longhuensis]
MIKLYGIKNCDTIKKARQYLEQHRLEYQFHDYRTDGITSELLTDFAAKLGWQPLLNTRGTTWRQLSDEQKANIDQQSALALMLSQPALIKRPVLAHGNEYLLGFSESSYEKFISTL